MAVVGGKVSEWMAGGGTEARQVFEVHCQERGREARTGFRRVFVTQQLLVSAVRQTHPSCPPAVPLLQCALLFTRCAAVVPVELHKMRDRRHWDGQNMAFSMAKVTVTGTASCNFIKTTASGGATNAVEGTTRKERRRHAPCFNKCECMPMLS
eukprot:358478-Chlamydomonas_euryale.AAC.3